MTKLIITLLALSYSLSAAAVKLYCRGPLDYTIVKAANYNSIHVNLKWHDEVIENNGRNLPAGKCSIDSSSILSNPANTLRYTLSSSFLGSAAANCLASDKCMIQTNLNYVTPATTGQGYYLVKHDMKINNTLFAKTPTTCKLPEGISLPEIEKKWGPKY